MIVGGGGAFFKCGFRSRIWFLIGCTLIAVNLIDGIFKASEL